jgi:hypothetical protein
VEGSLRGEGAAETEEGRKEEDERKEQGRNLAATVIQGVEKDFYLKESYDGGTPLSFRFNRQEYTLKMAKDPQGPLCLQADRPVAGLEPGSRIDVLFERYGTKFQFSVEAAKVRGNYIIAARKVEALRKGLKRSYVRVAPPAGLRAAFMFQEERYELEFPRLGSYEPVGQSPVSEDLQAVAADLSSWARNVADGLKVADFGKEQPRRLEERLVAGTGLILYMPSHGEGLARKDPAPEGRIMTERRFLQGLARLGYGEEAAEQTLNAFIKAKAGRGVYSEVWAPIRFQEYVLGYLCLWTKAQKGKPPLNYQAVETAARHARRLACAFQAGGRFEALRKPKEPFPGRILDISASGLRFSYPPSHPGLSLPPGVELGATLETPERSVRTVVRVERRLSAGRAEMGCRFMDMAAEDRSYLFEYLYGEPLSGEERPFLAGEV